MKRLLLSSACAVSFAACSAPAFAQEGATPDVGSGEVANIVSEIVVTPTRSQQSLNRVGQSVTVLNAGAIEASQAVSVADLLVQTPGVTVSRNGGVGQTTTLRIRGAESDQTVVIVDGVKLNDPSQPGAGYQLGNLLTGDVARIEVLRGAQSTLWGSQAIGGVVNIVTAQPTEPFAAKLEAEGGSMGTAYVRAAAGGRGEAVSWNLGASQLTASGVSAFRGGSEEDGYRNTTLNGRANLRLTDAASVDLRAAYIKGRTEIDGFPPPFYAFADSREYSETEDLVTYAGLNFGLLNGRLRNRVAYGYTRTDRDSFDPDQAVTPLTFDARGENRRYEYQGVFGIAEGWNATFGAEREDSEMRAAAPSPFAPNPPAARAKASIDGVYAQVQASFASGLTLTGGLRRDDHDTFGGRTVGQAAMAWSLPDGATVVRASFGQGFKAPSLYQLFSEYGNQGLRPEEADSWDAGVTHAVNDKLTVSATYFGRKTSNQIDFVTCPSVTTPASHPLCYVGGVKRFGFYDNIAKAKAEGIELTAAAKLGPVSMEGNYTWTKAQNDAAGSANFGRRLARRPEHQANLWIDWRGFGLGLRHVGSAFDDAANTTKLKSYTLVDLRASHPLNGRVSLYGRIENLTDEDYQTTGGYGAPGRAAYLGLRAKF